MTGKILTKTAVIFIILGFILCCASLVMSGFNVQGMVESTQNISKYDITDKFTKIDVSTTDLDITLLPSDDNTCHVKISSHHDAPSNVEVKNDTLYVSSSSKMNNINFGFYMACEGITIYLPATDYDLLNINSTSGDVYLGEDFIFNNIAFKGTSCEISGGATILNDFKIDLTSGDIHLAYLNTKNLSLLTTSGDISLYDINASGDISAKTRSGEIELETVTAANITIETTSGDINMMPTTTKGKLNITTTSGDVELQEASAELINVKTVSGDIEAFLPHNMSIEANSISGDIDIPHNNKNTSSANCKFNTTSGDIRVQYFEGESYNEKSYDNDYFDDDYFDE